MVDGKIGLREIPIFWIFSFKDPIFDRFAIILPKLLTALQELELYPVQSS